MDVSFAVYVLVEIHVARVPAVLHEELVVVGSESPHHPLYKVRFAVCHSRVVGKRDAQLVGVPLDRERRASEPERPVCGVDVWVASTYGRVNAFVHEIACCWRVCHDDALVCGLPFEGHGYPRCGSRQRRRRRKGIIVYGRARAVRVVRPHDHPVSLEPVAHYVPRLVGRLGYAQRNQLCHTISLFGVY